MPSTEAEEVDWLLQSFGVQDGKDPNRPSPGSPDGTVPLGVFVKFEVAAGARAVADEERRKKKVRAELLRQRAIEQAALVEARKLARGESTTQGKGPRGKDKESVDAMRQEKANQVAEMRRQERERMDRREKEREREHAIAHARTLEGRALDDKLDASEMRRT